MVVGLQLSRDELARKLAAGSASASPVVVTVTEFGPFEGIYKEETLTGDALKRFPAWLEKRFGNRDDNDNSKIWIDVDGAMGCSDVMAILRALSPASLHCDYFLS